MLSHALYYRSSRPAQVVQVRSSMSKATIRRIMKGGGGIAGSGAAASAQVLDENKSTPNAAGSAVKSPMEPGDAKATAPSGRRMEWYSDPYLLAARVEALLSGTDLDVQDAEDLIERHTGAVNSVVFSATIRGHIEPNAPSYTLALMALSQLALAAGKYNSATLRSYFNRGVVLLESIPDSQITIVHLNQFFRLCSICKSSEAMEYAWKTYMRIVYNLNDNTRGKRPFIDNRSTEVGSESEEVNIATVRTGWDNLEPDAHTFTTMLKLCGHSTIYEWFVRAQEIWEDHFVKSNAAMDRRLFYQVLRMYLYAPTGQFVRSTKGLHSPTMRVYDLAFKGFDLARAAFGLSEQTVRAKRQIYQHPAIGELRRKYRSNAVFEMDPATLDACMRICVRVWSSEQGIEFVNVAKSSNLVLDANLTESILASLVNAGKFADALQLACSASPAGTALTAINRGSAPTTGLYLADYEKYAIADSSLSYHWRLFRVVLKSRVVGPAV
ncbi:hypothetical protein HK405_014802, partial [Cladochytrium tenue]